MLDADAAIRDVVHSLAARFQPERVILFGSRARGDHHEHSDIDLLVVVEECQDPRQLGLEIARALNGCELDTDIKLTTPELLARNCMIPGKVERDAIREGRVVYEREAWMTESAQDWLRFAVGDYADAESLFAVGGQSRNVAYISQQAAEKALKAALYLEAGESPHTHDLDQIRSRLPGTWNLDVLEVDWRLLTRQVRARYPELGQEPSPAEAEQALNDARLIVEAVAAEFARRGLAPE